mgnify:FL=1
MFYSRELEVYIQLERADRRYLHIFILYAVIALEKYTGGTEYLSANQKTINQEGGLMGIQRTLTCVRHGEAVVPKGSTDGIRHLSEKGRRQAAERRRSLEDPSYGLVIVSSQIRTMETALVVSGMENNRDAHYRIDEAPEIYTPLAHDNGSRTARKTLEDMYRELAGQPLSTYLVQPEFQVHVLNQFGERAWSAVMNEIVNREIPDTLVVGHDVYLQAMALAASPHRGQVVLDRTLDECGGFEMDLDGFDVRKISWFPKLAETD